MFKWGGIRGSHRCQPGTITVLTFSVYFFARTIQFIIRQIPIACLVTLENDPGRETVNSKVHLWGLNNLVNSVGEKKQFWKFHFVILSAYNGKTDLASRLLTLYSQAQSEN